MSLYQSLAPVAQAALDFKNMARMRYSAAERASLFSALLNDQKDTRLLNFRVSYGNSVPFRIALREIFIKGDYLFQATSDSPVILDCGANIGLATLFFKHLYPKARISCFEADPNTASILQKNIDQNYLQDVNVHNLMLSNNVGEHSFYVSTNTSGSLLSSSEPGRMKSCREIRVKTERLSNFIDGPVDLLKLDVEGSEFDVMTDLRDTGKLAQISRMVIEYHHKIDGKRSCISEFLALLEEEGFEYQIDARWDLVSTRQGFQDMLIGAYRPA